MQTSIPFGDSGKSGRRYTLCTMDIQEIRRQRLAQLIKDQYGTQANFIEQTNENQGEISALLRDKSFGEKKARKLEQKCGLPPFWLDGSPAAPELTDRARSVAQAFDLLDKTQQDFVLNLLQSYGVLRLNPESESASVATTKAKSETAPIAIKVSSSQQSSGSS